MELIRREMPKTYKLAVISDLHCGSTLFKEDLFVKNVIKKDTPDQYYVFNGDLIEGIVPGDKRFTLHALDRRFKSPQDQADYMSSLLEPLKEKILAFCIGNHELKILNTFDAIKHISGRLKIDSQNYGAGIYKFVALNSGKVMHKFLMTHGKWLLPAGAKDPIQREANRKAAQKRHLEKLGHSDCIASFCGHHHFRLIVEPTVDKHLYLTDDGQKIRAKYRVQSKQNVEYIPSESRWYVGSGSYRGHLTDPGSLEVDYAELYEPADLGHVNIVVEDGEVVTIEDKGC